MSDWCQRCEVLEARLRAVIRAAGGQAEVGEDMAGRIEAARAAAEKHGYLPEVLTECMALLGRGPRLVEFLEGLVSGPFISERYRMAHPEVDDAGELVRP